MPEVTDHEWVLPASIPFEDLKAADLEECVYWLLDAMGAKDLEWRTGGKGGGAADGGRDLEASLFVPDSDGELVEQKWWVECKGRKGTVDPDDVKSAVNNALAYKGIDCVIIATNSRFSNPTRDWVQEWQRNHPRPKINLWDRAHLERYLSRHPDVVLRLFSEALSLQGRFQAMETRFWNKLEYVAPQALTDIWKSRDDIDMTAMGVFAAIANEFSQGTINNRPWGAVLEKESIAEVLSVGLVNAFYLCIRSSKAGADQKIIMRAFAYLILLALKDSPPEQVERLVSTSICRGDEDGMPKEAREMLLMPIADQLQSELQDVCASDCERISMLDRNVLTGDKDEVEDYWLRLEPDGVEEETDRRILRLEKHDAPCRVGFHVDKDHGCPLFEFEPTIDNFGAFLSIIQRVTKFRRNESAMARREKEAREYEIKGKHRAQDAGSS